MKDLKEKLKYLKENHSLVGLKGGTEVEAMSFEEIYLMKQICRGVVPMTVKIGGPEARNDIEFMLSIEVEKILAPMIESPYSLKNFVETMNDLDKSKKTKLAVNIETIFSYTNLHYIFGSPYFKEVDQVTVGRTDLSGSLDKDVDDFEVLNITKRIVESAKYYGKVTSIGGKVNPENAVSVANNIGSNYINTRHMVVACESKNIAKDVEACLVWEKEFYQYLQDNFSSRSVFYQKRVNSIDERIKTKVLV